MAKGDFDRIFEQYKPLLYSTLRKLAFDADHDDVFQEASVALWEAYERFDPEKGFFGAYAVKYVRGKVLSYVRKEHRHRASMPFSAILKEEDNHPFEWPDERSTDAFQTCEWVDWLQPAVASLSPRESTLIREHFFKGKTIREIAQEEQVSLETVKTWRKRALQKCRRQLSPDEIRGDI